MARPRTDDPGGGTFPQPPWNPYVTSLNPTWWWKMNELSGTVASDSADGDIGTYYAPVTLNEPGIITSSADPCPLFTPNGTMDASTVAFPTQVGSWTLAIALKSAIGAGAIQGICGLYDPGNLYATTTAMYALASGVLQVSADIDDSTTSSIAGTTSIMDGNMHLVSVGVVVGAGGNGLLYGWQDGLPLAGSPASFGAHEAGEKYATAGYAASKWDVLHSTSFRWNGQLQSFLVWATTLLTDAQQAGLWAAVTA